MALERTWTQALEQGDPDDLQVLWRWGRLLECSIEQAAALLDAVYLHSDCTDDDGGTSDCLDRDDGKRCEAHSMLVKASGEINHVAAKHLLEQWEAKRAYRLLQVS